MLKYIHRRMANASQSISINPLSQAIMVIAKQF